jgi:hypothetical protein
MASRSSVGDQDLLAPYDGLRWGTGERPVFLPSEDRAPQSGRLRLLPNLYDDLDDEPTEPQLSVGHVLASLEADDDATLEVPGDVLDSLRVESAASLARVD